MINRSSGLIALGTVVGVALGGALGYMLPDVMLIPAFLGGIFLNALQLVAVPLIVCAVIVGMASFPTTLKSGRAVGTTVLYFLGTTVVAAAIGLILCYVIQPGAGLDRSLSAAPQQFPYTHNDVFGSLLPGNLLDAVASGHLFGLVLLAMAVGAMLAGMGRRARPVVDFLQIVYRALLKVTEGLMYAAPVGLLCLVGSVVAGNVDSIGRLTSQLSYLTLTLLVAFAFQALVVLPLILRLVARRPVLSYFGNLVPALGTALGTGSKAAALPVTLEAVCDRAKVDKRTGSVVLPLGMAVNMDGTAIFVMVCSVFVAQHLGVPLSVLQILGIAGVAVFLPVGAVALPGAGMVVLATAFRTAGLPDTALGWLAVLAVVGWLFDRLRATVDVWGDAVGAASVAELTKAEAERSAKRLPDRRTDRTRGKVRTPAPRPSSRRQPPRPPDRRQPADGDRRGRSAGGQSPRHRQTTRREERTASRSRQTERQPEPRLRERHKPSPFEIPSSASHEPDLEPALRSRDDDRVTEPSSGHSDLPESSGPGSTEGSVSLSEETVRRERAKVTAQLAAMRRKEETQESNEHLQAPSAGSGQSGVDDVADRPVNADNGIAEGDRVREPSSEPSTGTEATASPDGTNDADAAEVPAEYGRTPSRRGEGARAHVGSSPDNAAGNEGNSEKEDSEGKASYSLEKQTFGRTKRKRSR